MCSQTSRAPRSKHRRDACPSCGNPKDARASRCRSLACRFRRRIEVDAAGCWLWTGRVEPSGYARMSVSGRHVMSHRVAYTLLVGPIPDGLELDHLCRVRRCVNPEHLEPVTPVENTRRGEAISQRFRARTHCEQGHPFDIENTEWVERPGKRPYRQCRACRRKR